MISGIPRNSNLSFLNAEYYYWLGIWKHYSGSLTFKYFKAADLFLANKIYFGNRRYKKDQNKALPEEDERLRRDDSALNFLTKLLTQGPSLWCRWVLVSSSVNCSRYSSPGPPGLLWVIKLQKSFANLGHLVECWLLGRQRTSTYLLQPNNLRPMGRARTGSPASHPSRAAFPCCSCSRSRALPVPVPSIGFKLWSGSKTENFISHAKIMGSVNYEEVHSSLKWGP